MPEKIGVFISHITEERPVALVLQNYLRKAFGPDFRVFVSSDSKSIGGGKKWFDYIIQNLRVSRVVLVLVSQESRRREWINFEAGFGDGAETVVIPVSIKNLPLGQLSFPLAGYQGRNVDAIGAIIDDIANAEGKTAEPVDGQRYVEDLREAEAKLRYLSLVLEPFLSEGYLTFTLEKCWEC